MGELILIAAIGRNNELGIDNHLIWYLKDDLQFFKNNTMGHPIVMGYNTFISLPKLLPGRKHIVLTHKDIELQPDVEVYHDKEQLLNHLQEYNDNVYIIGGASIYSQFIEYADELLLTEIDASNKADTFFPSIDLDKWNQEVIDNNSEKGVMYKHVRYRRKNN